MHVSSSIVAGSPKSMNQPLELQLGFLRPTDFAHPRSQSDVPSQKHILALHTSATSAAGVSAGVSAFTYRHKHRTVNNLWIICHFQPTNFTCIPSICTAKYTLKARWFVFALESLEEPEEQNMTTFTVRRFSLIMSEKKVPSCSLHMLLCQCIFQWYSTLGWKYRYLLQSTVSGILMNLATEVAFFG